MTTVGGEAPTFPAAGLDALPPAGMARRAEDVGVTKASLATGKILALSVLAGAFIAMGAVFSTTVTAGTAELAFGVVRLLAGLTFSLGLILVIVAGAELFTGNNLIVMAWAGRRVTTALLLRNWLLVYVGNFAGALGTVVLVYLSGQYEFGGDAVGQQALAIATAKTSLGFGQAFVLGALCNALVCLAVWLCYSARSTADRDPGDRPADRGLRRRRVRAQRGQHVLHPDRAAAQAERRLGGRPREPARPLRPDVEQLPLRQPPPGHSREHRRRRAHGRRGLLVRLPPRRGRLSRAGPPRPA